MNKARLRDAASAAVLERHPELNGLVSFDIEYVSAESFTLCFDLVVKLHGYEQYEALLQMIADAGELVGFNECATDLEGILDQVLDHYRVVESAQEGQFVFEKYRWYIGDGDDGGAVRMNGSREARVWVRTWWEKA